MAKHAVFLDRDGTIIVNKHYLGDPAGVELIPGASDALLKLQMAGYLLFIVSNQSGVGRGMFTVDDLNKVNQRMIELLGGVHFSEIYNCICKPDDPKCNCRKPSPKYLFKAEEKYHINLRKSYFIGDRETDVECGINGGCKSILVMTGEGAGSKEKLAGKKFSVAKDINEAADLILKNG